ncbi:MAG TPA: twin-arginine translocase TatA/TatE family subunit [Gemmatimonadetes bacterium]|nr:twin-arginine translocase TatA/TatE family subunit [Gemmatimonadota bacterium]
MGLGGLGMWEMIMIFLVVLLLFGAKRLPEIGSSLGKGIREFKGSIKEIEKEVKAVEEPTRDVVTPPPPSPGQSDGGPRRLTTSPAPEASHGGGVPTQESVRQEAEGTVETEADDAEVSNARGSEEEAAEPEEGAA